MTCAPAVAHRAARQLRLAILVIAALVLAVTASATTAPPAEAAYAPRVVIVVGPAGGSTGDYLDKARSYAAQAKAYGASVTSILHPRATWTRVLAAAQGANVLIYLGHGNGWPSPYGPWQTRTKDGLGLNPYDGAPASRVKYYGEEFIRQHIRLAPGAIVLLNRLCYASGNGEPGMAEPTWSTAVRRVDNYAAGFMDAGAAAVLADGHTSLGWELAMLFGGSRPMRTLWTSDPDANGHVRSFSSRRTGGATARLDPDRPSAGYYRSLVTRGSAPSGAIRIAAMWQTATSRTTLRAGPGTGAASLGVVGDGARLVARGAITSDGLGRTWVPVMTRAGRQGYVAGWVVRFSGTTRTRTSVVLRSKPTTSSARRTVLTAGTRVTITGSTHDRRERSWLRVETAGGRTGWIAAWLTRP